MQVATRPRGYSTRDRNCCDGPAARDRPRRWRYPLAERTLFSMSQGWFWALLSRHGDIPYHTPCPANGLDGAISITFGG